MPIVSGIADAFVGVSKLLGYLSPILKPLMIIYGIFKGIHLLVSGIGRGLKLIGKISKINLGTKLSELKTQLGIDNLMKKGFMKAKAAHALNKLGLLTNKQAAFWKGRVTHFEMQKLGLSKKNLGMENASLMTSIKNTAQKRLQNIFGKEGLVQSFARNAAERINNTLTAIGLGFNRENLIVMRDYLSSLLDFVKKNKSEGKTKKEITSVSEIPNTPKRIEAWEGALKINIEQAYDYLNR